MCGVVSPFRGARPLLRGVCPSSVGHGFPDAPFLWGPRFLRWTRRPQRAICRDGLRTPGLAGHHPAGAESLRGQGPFLFLRKKKRFLTPRRRKVRTTPFPPCGENSVPLPCASSPHKSFAFAGAPGRSSGRLRASTAACGFPRCGVDHSRPLRPSHSGTGSGLRLYPAAACGCRSRGRMPGAANATPVLGARLPRRAIPPCRGGQCPPLRKGCVWEAAPHDIPRGGAPNSPEKSPQ